jgi:arylsulfatase A-like enzyme
MSVFSPTRPTVIMKLNNAGYHTILSQGNTGWGGVASGFAGDFKDVFIWSVDRSQNRMARELNALRSAIKGHEFIDYFRYMRYRFWRKMGRQVKPVSPPMRDARRLCREAMRMIHGSPDDSPVLCWINFMEMHQPYTPPRDCRPESLRRAKTAAKNISPSDFPQEMGKEDRLLTRELYDACGKEVDRAIGEFLGQLDTLRPGRPRTIVVFSDHGEEFWDHGENADDPTWYGCGVGHGHTLYNELVHVPLIFHGEGFDSGVRLTDPVSVADLAPTLAALANGCQDTDAGGGVCLKGQSSDSDRIVFSESLYYGPQRRAAIDSQFKLIQCPSTQSEQLFAWADDPLEKEDRIEDPSLEDRIRRLRDALEERGNGKADLSESTTLTQEEQDALNAQLRDLGYI